MVGIIINVIGIITAIIGIIAVIRTWILHTDSNKQLMFMWSGIFIMWIGRLITAFGL